MTFLTRSYTVYALIIFIFTCLIFIPTLVILSQKKSWHHVALRAHEMWSWTFFIMVFIPVRIEKRFNPIRGQQYIFCANHFSYLDIPTVLLVIGPKFIGKSSLTKIPVFGHFYRKIHITVDRASFRSRAESLRKAKETLDEGFNVAFFPEGGVKVKEENIPNMMPFRDGAFKLSAEKNIPIVPLSLVYNYRLFPDKKPIRFHHHECRIVIGKPIYPQGNSDAEIKKLKEATFNSIQNELDRYHPDKVNVVS